jgi:hypothetical protein
MKLYEKKYGQNKSENKKQGVINKLNKKWRKCNKMLSKK